MHRHRETLPALAALIALWLVASGCPHANRAGSPEQRQRTAVAARPAGPEQRVVTRGGKGGAEGVKSETTTAGPGRERVSAGEEQAPPKPDDAVADIKNEKERRSGRPGGASRDGPRRAIVAASTPPKDDRGGGGATRKRIASDRRDDENLIPSVQPGPQIKPVPRAEGEVPAMRAGALRLTGAKNASYKVLYTPEAGLGVRGLDRALGGRKVGAEVKPFAQRRGGGGADQQDVEQGGEIAALAIALQLQRGGWVVDMLDKASLRAGMSPPSGEPRALALRFAISGEVSFTVGPRGAILDGTVRCSSKNGEVAAVHARGAAPLGASGPRSGRYGRAATAALRSFVRAVIGDAGLAAKLVAHVARAAR